MEAVAHQAAGQGVGDRGDGHALVVGHEGVDDRHLFALGDARGRIVERLVKPVAAASPGGLQPFEIAGGGFRVDHAGQGRGVGRDHRIVGQAPLQPQAGHAEVGILVGELKVAGVIGRLRHAPGRLQRRAIFDLAPHDQAIGLFGQAVDRRPHDQRGHQIFEHRARPGDQRRPVADRGHGMAEPEPVAGRHIALGDGHETGQPRLGRHQVVAVLVEGAFAHLVADRQQQPVGVDQEAEIHVQRHGPGQPFQRFEPPVERPDHAVGQVAPVAFQAGADRLGPEQQIRFVGMISLQGDLPGGVHQGQGLFGQLDHLQGDAGGRFGQAQGEPADLLLEPPQGHALRAPAVDHATAGAPGQIEGVGHPFQPPPVGGRHIAPFVTGVGQGDQMARQIAAVDRRDILRIERAQIARIVPVEEMAPPFGHARHGFERGFQPLDGLQRTDPAEVAGAGRRQKIQAEIGGRGPVGDHRLGQFLKIVRREHVLQRGDEGLEKAPGLARDQAQRAGVALGQRLTRLGLGRQARAQRQLRRHKPGQGEEGRQGPGAVSPERRDGDRRPAQHQSAGHAAIETVGAEAQGRGGLGRGHPFQQVAAGDGQPDQGPQDGVGHQPGLVRQEDDHQAGLDQRLDKFPAQRLEVTGQHDPGPMRGQVGGHGQQGRDDHRQQDEQGPDQRFGQGQDPAGDQGADQGDGRERTAQIVQHLPAADGGNPAAARPDRDV